MKFLLFLLLTGCAQTDFLATQKHVYSKAPQRVFWFQIAGFDLHHVGLLKFTDWEKFENLEFENFQCHGDAWNYNLFSLRPDHYESFNSQLTGSLSQWNKCESFKEKPFWSFLSEKNFSQLIIENGGSNKESLLKSVKCRNDNWLSNSFFLKRDNQKVTDVSTTPYYRTNKSMLLNGVYRDSSCQKGECFQSLEKTMASIFARWKQRERRFVMLYRDLEYVELIEKKKFKSAAKKLKEINDAITYLKKKFPKENTLFLVTGSAPLQLNYPSQGAKWSGLERSVRSEQFGLMSKVLASGTRAENFCGSYNNSEVFNRIFWGKKKYKFL